MHSQPSARDSTDPFLAPFTAFNPIHCAQQAVSNLQATADLRLMRCVWCCAQGSGLHCGTGCGRNHGLFPACECPASPASTAVAADPSPACHLQSVKQAQPFYCQALAVIVQSCCHAPGNLTLAVPWCIGHIGQASRLHEGQRQRLGRESGQRCTQQFVA
jgi:hypothetical protein